MHNLELEAHRSIDNPFLMGIKMMVYLSNTQSLAYILSLVQLLSQNSLQSMSLFVQQLIPLWLYNTQNIFPNHSNSAANRLLERQTRIVIEDNVPCRLTSMEGLPHSTHINFFLRPSSPKR